MVPYRNHIDQLVGRYPMTQTEGVKVVFNSNLFEWSPEMKLATIETKKGHN